ncbi:hypothetical protein BC835DRAFT_1410583 [Cytidiella melzeri]|nr:hypothetical protein BC835DRAFT_1410583 [Cytidiella melzeri]
MDQQPASSPALPPELKMDILELLQYRELLRCRLVSRWFQRTIDNHSSFQYKISLAIAGMRDNPTHRANDAEKLALLTQYCAKWSSSSFISDIQAVDGMKTYPTTLEYWVLAAGVLAQEVDTDRIEFTRLPATIRGIREKTWSVKLPCPQVVDFFIDPAQDLLVLIEQNLQGQTKSTIHFLNIFNAEAHQLARQATVDWDAELSDDISYYKSHIYGPYMGLHVSDGQFASVLTVWNWHTGETSLILSNDRLTSFVFLNDTYLLTMMRKEWVDDPEPTLNFVDYRHSGANVRLELLLPPIPDGDEVVQFELMCEPGSAGLSSSGDPPPFYLLDANALGDYLLVLRVREINRAVTFSILVSRLLELLVLFPRLVQVQWHHWGARGCFVDEVLGQAESRGCSVFGTKYGFLRPAAEGPGVEIVIREFGERWRRWEAARRILASRSKPESTLERKALPPFLSQGPSDSIVFKDSDDSSTENFSSWDTLGALANHFLESSASTSIPFVELVMPCSWSASGDEVMLSGDSIVVMTGGGADDATENIFEVYSC